MYQTLLSGFDPVTALPPGSVKSLCPMSAAATTAAPATSSRSTLARIARLSLVINGFMECPLVVPLDATQAPLRLKTATTVHHMILRSSPSDMVWRYSTSSRSRWSNVAALRSLTCHRPVIPGTTSSRSVCHRS